VVTDTHAIIEEFLETASSVLFLSRIYNRADRCFTRSMIVRFHLQKETITERSVKRLGPKMN
jgi:hypothetical protein